ncbi:hypothetical protein COV16_02375 [Candidatus Woesearchaeota archaeon CG10_big_fil_rev_8_21_14_0_10_34_8]|nr:MAG: hypothetical protein COV16_02375 [Candidatus Woesearchaeota archaeon CG10_big_fil_rev_8_21_14_0_10_34_8]
MLLLGIGANIGVYSGAAVQMQKWHMFFDFTMFGIFTGMLEAAFWSFIALYTFGWIYNKYA